MNVIRCQARSSVASSRKLCRGWLTTFVIEKSASIATLTVWKFRSSLNLMFAAPWTRTCSHRCFHPCRRPSVWRSMPACSMLMEHWSTVFSNVSMRRRCSSCGTCFARECWLACDSGIAARPPPDHLTHSASSFHLDIRVWRFLFAQKFIELVSIFSCRPILQYQQRIT